MKLKQKKIKMMILFFSGFIDLFTSELPITAHMDPHSIVTHVTSSVLMVMYNFDMYNDVTFVGKKIFWAINERRGE